MCGVIKPNIDTQTQQLAWFIHNSQSSQLPSGNVAAGCPGSQGVPACQCWACKQWSFCLFLAQLAAHKGGYLAAVERPHKRVNYLLFVSGTKIIFSVDIVSSHCYALKSVLNSKSYTCSASYRKPGLLIISPSETGRIPRQDRWASVTCCRPHPRANLCPHLSTGAKGIRD